MKKFLILIFAILVYAQNSSFNLQITNATIGVYADSGFTQQNFKIRGFYLYNDNENMNNFYLLGMKAEGNLIGSSNENLKFSVLMDFVHTKNNSALPLGIGMFTYLQNFSLPIFLRCEAEYAPKVLSFDDADRFSRIDVALGYTPIVNAEIFVGYRNISFNHNYNSVVYGGVGYNF